MLRHTCTTHLLHGGADIRHVQALLGHENLSTTAVYTHVAVKDLREVLARRHSREQAGVRKQRRYNMGVMAATAAKIVYPHITKNSGICSGRACVAGTRVRVMDIVSLHNAGLTPDDIVREFPSLESPVDIYAALVYYADHRDEIDGDFAEDRRLADESERERLEHLGR